MVFLSFLIFRVCLKYKLGKLEKKKQKQKKFMEREVLLLTLLCLVNGKLVLLFFFRVYSRNRVCVVELSLSFFYHFNIRNSNPLYRTVMQRNVKTTGRNLLTNYSASK